MTGVPLVVSGTSFLVLADSTAPIIDKKSNCLMNKNELKEQVINLRAELTGILKKSETCFLENSEETRLAEIRSQIDSAQEQINKIEADERALAASKITSNKTENKMKKFNLFETVRNIANGTVTDEQRAYVNGNKIDVRAAIVAGTAGEGQENVPEDKEALDVAIRNNSILDKIGATWFPNAVGDVSIPKYSGSNVLWKGEVVDSEDGAGQFSEVVLQPKRLTAYVDISRTFLAQDANSAESILVADLAAAVAEKLDKTVFGDGAGDTNTPAGIFAGIAAETSIGNASYSDVLDLEEKVEEKNGNDYMFVVSPKVKFALKGEQLANGLGFVYEGQEIDGYPTISSNSVVSKGMVCLDPRDLAVATWGMEITVDNVSRAINNEVRLVINYLVDAKLRGDRVAQMVYTD